MTPANRPKNWTRSLGYSSVADLPKTQPVRRGHRTGAGAVASPDDAGELARVAPAEADIDQRADHGAHLVVTETLPAHLEAQDTVAEIIPMRVENPPDERWWRLVRCEYRVAGKTT